ncbi:MAG: IS110 family transposase [Oscillibacter sp.]|nr:IS110 family transposase [Oscillibacter sp.]
MIPGVGPLLAAAILSEIGDISRFPFADKLAAYVGVAPSINQTGEFVDTSTYVSGRGSPYLR